MPKQQIERSLEVFQLADFHLMQNLQDMENHLNPVVSSKVDLVKLATPPTYRVMNTRGKDLVNVLVYRHPHRFKARYFTLTLKRESGDEELYLFELRAAFTIGVVRGMMKKHGWRSLFKTFRKFRTLDLEKDFVKVDKGVVSNRTLALQLSNVTPAGETRKHLIQIQRTLEKPRWVTM